MQTTTPGRKRQPPRPLVWVAIALALAAIMYFVVWPQVVAEQARSDRAILIIAAEIDHLPPFGGVSEAQRLISGFPGSRPLIEVVYPQIGTCSEVQAHYTQVASAAGWTANGQERSGHDVIGRYSKLISGYHLVLSIDCISDDATGVPHGGYTLDIRE